MKKKKTNLEWNSLEENRKLKLMEIRCGSVANEGFTKVKTDSARGYTWVKNEEVA